MAEITVGDVADQIVDWFNNDTLQLATGRFDDLHGVVPKIHAKRVEEETPHLASFEDAFQAFIGLEIGDAQYSITVNVTP